MMNSQSGYSAYLETQASLIHYWFFVTDVTKKKKKIKLATTWPWSLPDSNLAPTESDVHSSKDLLNFITV